MVGVVCCCLAAMSGIDRLYCRKWPLICIWGEVTTSKVLRTEKLVIITKKERDIGRL